jgi:hypothetical protein
VPAIGATDLWYDEVVERTDRWMTVRVRTPDGRQVYYRIMTTPLAEATG